MTVSSEFLARLRALSANVAMLEVTIGKCACELESLLELATALDPLPNCPSRPLNVGHFVVDRRTFSVSDGKRGCELGNTICFRFFEYLANSPNRYFTRGELLAAVWEGQRRDATTIRSAVFKLRTQFRKAGMDELADAIRSNGRAYGLMFDLRMSPSQRKTNG